MSSSDFYELICEQECRNTHHKLVMNSLMHLSCPDTEKWQDLFERYFEYYLDGSKAPDKKFKDFRNHVLHVSDNYWGGPVKQANYWYDVTVTQLKNEDWKSAVYAAGVLSHYYMDPLMPLHTGQTEEEGVIHRPCEWSVNKAFDELIDILEDESGYPKIELPSGDEWLKEAIHQGAEVAHAHYDTFINQYDLALGVKDPPEGLDDELCNITAQLLGHASVGFARILERAFADANSIPPTPKVGFLQQCYYRITFPVSWAYRGYRHWTGRGQVKRIASEYKSNGKVVKSLPVDERTVRKLHAREVLKKELSELDAQPIRKVGNYKALVGERPLQPANESASPSSQSEPAIETPPTSKPTQTKSPPTKSTSVKFRLDRNDALEAAPSIGAKTAARFETVDIYTVGDFLDADAEQTAMFLNTRHITPDTIRLWQTQARLACQIPQIYGHDAQILVACGFESPEEIAESEPEVILSLVGEFKKTQEAKFIIRDKSSDPDLEEVTDWIEWSRQSRHLDAA